MSYLNELHSRLSDLTKRLLPQGEVDSEVRRVAGHFSITALAGELANEFAIMNWDNDAPFNAAKKCFDTWLVERGGTKSAEETIIIEKVKRLILQQD